MIARDDWVALPAARISDIVLSTGTKPPTNRTLQVSTIR